MTYLTVTCSNSFLGLKKSNYTLTIFIRVRNLDGLEAKATATCKVREREKMSEKEFSDALSLSMQAVKENNNEEALSKLENYTFIVIFSNNQLHITHTIL